VGFNVICKDKFTLADESFDFLKDDWEGKFGVGDIMIFNPPFSKKTEFIERALEYLNYYEEPVPFIALLPLQTMVAKKSFQFFMTPDDDMNLVCAKPSVHVQVISPTPLFKTVSGDLKTATDVGWFWFNFKFGEGRKNDHRSIGCCDLNTWEIIDYKSEKGCRWENFIK
jgi:hypothetical protein